MLFEFFVGIRFELIRFYQIFARNSKRNTMNRIRRISLAWLQNNLPFQILLLFVNLLICILQAGLRFRLIVY
jgi:hypothetical protein